MSSLLNDRGLPSQRAVVYLSSVPTDMRPNEVREVFAKYGDIFRQKFVPRPTPPNRPNASLQFKEGWLEFTDAEAACEAAHRLNASPVDTRRTRRCYGQNWTCRVLEGFTWDDLAHEREGKRRTEQQTRHDAVQRERATNEQFRKLVAASRAKVAAARPAAMPVRSTEKAPAVPTQVEKRREKIPTKAPRRPAAPQTAAEAPAAATEKTAAHRLQIEKNEPRPARGADDETAAVVRPRKQRRLEA